MTTAILVQTDKGLIVVVFDGSFTGAECFAFNRGYKNAKAICLATDEDIKRYPIVKR